MNIENLLEERSDRGNVRGAANVWFDAESIQSKEQTKSRKVLVGATLAIWFLSLTALFALDDSQTKAISDIEIASSFPNEIQPNISKKGSDQENESESEIKQPARIDVDIEGIDLQRVSEPLGLTVEEQEDLLQRLGTEHPTQIVVFGEKEDPFVGPLIFVEVYDNRIKTQTVNIDDYEAYTDYISLSENGDLQALPSSGLSKLSTLDGNGTKFLKSLETYQYEFAESPNQSDEGVWAVLQAEALEDYSSLEAILYWLHGSNESVVSKVKILSNDGVVVQDPDSERSDVVIWIDDGYMYRFSVGEFTGRRTLLGKASENISALKIVSEDDWNQQLGSVEKSESAWLVLVLAAGVLFAVSAIFYAFKKAFISCVISLAPIGVSVFWVSSDFGFIEIGFCLISAFTAFLVFKYRRKGTSLEAV